MLRKSAVAVKPKKTLPKKRKPATLKEMLASAKKGAIESPKSKRPKAKQPAPIATNQSESSDSDDYQPLKTLPARLPLDISERQEAIAARQGPSGRTNQEEHGTGTGVRAKPTKVKRGKGNQDRPALVARECPTNSSQEEEGESGSQSKSSGTRKSTRRRKPVDKMGGVMIDNIQGAEKKWNYPGEGNK